MALKLETCPAGIIVKYKNGSGAIQSKIVNPNDVAEALANRSRLDTGILPRNTRYYSRLDNGHNILVLEVPEHIHRIEYSDIETAFDVPMPYLCFIIHFVARGIDSVVDLTIRKVYLYAAHGPILDDNSVLYQFPFGNVFNNGDVCTGRVVYPTGISMRDLGIVPSLILDSKFNGDLSDGVFEPFETEEGIVVRRSEHLLRYLHSKDKFRYSVLHRPNTFGNILRNIITSIQGGGSYDVR